MKKQANPKIKPAHRRKQPEGAPLERNRQHGPQKEKTQITVRIDTELMNRAYAQIKKDNARITDVIEEGLILALKQRDQDMPPLTNRVRFVVANTTKTQQEQIEGFLIFLVMDDLEKLSPPDTLLRTLILDYLELIKRVPDRRERALALYSRYGRTPEELAQMAGS